MREAQVEAGVEGAVVEKLVVLGAEELIDDRQQTRARVGDRRQLVAVGLVEDLEQVVDELDGHLLLGAEVVDEEARRDAEAAGDLGDGRALQTLLEERLVVGLEHLPPPLLRALRALHRPPVPDPDRRPRRLPRAAPLTERSTCDRLYRAGGAA